MTFKNYKRWVVAVWSLVAVVTLGMLFSQPSSALSGSPQDIYCDSPPYAVNNVHMHQRCEARGSIFNPPGKNYARPVLFVWRKGESDLQTVVRLGGYPAMAQCNSEHSSVSGQMHIHLCMTHSPAPSEYPGMLDWWGPFFGTNSAAEQMAASVEYAFGLPQVNRAAGWRIAGTSAGGTGGTLQAAAMRIYKVHQSLVSVFGIVPHTLFMEKPRHVGDRGGQYWRDPQVQATFAGFNLDLLDVKFALEKGHLNEVYFSFHGGENDHLGYLDARFFEACEAARCAAFATWDQGGHEQGGESGVNFPRRYTYGENQEYREDLMMPVFSESSANRVMDQLGRQYGRGHYNAGLSFDVTGEFWDRPDEISVPIRYKRLTNIGKGVPDQPLQAVFRFSLRRVVQFDYEEGDTLFWRLGDSVGEFVAEKEISIPGLLLESGDDYVPLKISREPLVVVGPGKPEACQPMMYTSMPRDMRPLGEAEDRSAWQVFSDVRNINRGFGESDIGIQRADCSREIVFDCTGQDRVCAALEGAVNHAGTHALFSVLYGTALGTHSGWGVDLITDAKEAKIYLYDIKTGALSEIPNQNPGDIYRMPDWLNENTFVLSSNEGDQYPYRDQFSYHRGLFPDGRSRLGNPPWGVSQTYGYGKTARSMRIWRMNLDGTGKYLMTPAENNAITPRVVDDRVYFVSHQAGEDKAFYGPHPSNNPGTTANKWWLLSSDHWGRDVVGVLGAHNTPPIDNKRYLKPGTVGGQQEDKFLAFRAPGEMGNGMITIHNYYRATHLSVANAYALSPYSEPSIEGCLTAGCLAISNDKNTSPGSGRFVNHTLTPLCPGATGQDIRPRRDAMNRPMGGCGYHEPLDDGSTLMTRLRGYGYNQLQRHEANRAFLGGEPPADFGIYRMKGNMITDFFDEAQVEVVLDDPAVHELDAYPIRKRAVPAYQPGPQGGDCHFAIADARNAEIMPAQPYKWGKLGLLTAEQGPAVNHETYAEEVYSIAFYQAENHDSMYPEKSFSEAVNFTGLKREWLLGEAVLENDGSVYARVPCGVPLKISGHDKRGLKIAHDAMLHALHPGETRGCGGCHQHSYEAWEKAGRPTVKDMLVGAKAMAKPPQRVMDGKYEPLWPKARRAIADGCGKCHTGFEDDGLLWDRFTADNMQLDFADWLPVQPAEKNNLRRPYYSRFVARFARWSPGYWYCVDERTDGKTNDQYPDDIDFKPHQSGMSEEQCTAIAKWIDVGAPRD